jgi:DNA topoisomerase-1
MWDEPVAGECPACGFPLLARKKPRSGGPYIGCPTKGCNYRQKEESTAEEE